MPPRKNRSNSTVKAGQRVTRAQARNEEAEGAESVIHVFHCTLLVPWLKFRFKQWTPVLMAKRGLLQHQIWLFAPPSVLVQASISTLSKILLTSA
jgi:hypothetical protein